MPHLILGRIRSPQGAAGLSRLIEELAAAGAEVSAFAVDRLCLMESRLTRLGPQYTVLEEASLGGGGSPA